jgi:hypothetical protein
MWLSGKLVVVTGVSGFLGMRTVATLRAGGRTDVLSKLVAVGTVCSHPRALLGFRRAEAVVE